MSLHIYHPNKASKGFACSFWFSEKEDCTFARIIKQSGWDDKNQNGVFKDSLNDPEKNTIIKLSFVEVAAILDCIDRNREFKAFHDNDQAPKSIGFTPWIQAAFQDKPAVMRGYSFTVTVGSKEDSTKKNSFFIGLTFAEGRYIREFLMWVFSKHFDNYSNYKKNSYSDTVKEQPNDVTTAATEPEAVPTASEPEESEETVVNKPVETSSKDSLLDW